MDAVESGLLQENPWVPRRRLTVEDYHRMGEAGIFGPHERVELIEGEIVAMTPIGSHHAGTVNMLNTLLVTRIGRQGIVSVQNPMRLGGYSEPEPDFTVLKPRDDHYYSRHPRAEDVLLAIEIAESSLPYDRAIKRPLYARHGIPELWIVDIAAGEVEVCRGPASDGYADIRRVGRDEILEPVALPGVTIPVAEFLRGA